MFKNFNIGIRLGLGFSLVLILLAIISYIGIIRLSDLDGKINLISHDRYPKTALANEIGYLTMDNTRIVRNLILLTDEQSRATNKEALDKNRARIVEDFDKLDKAINTEQGRAHFKEMQEARPPFLSYSEEVVQLAMANKGEEATKLLYGENYKTQAAYLSSIKKFVEFVSSQMDDASNQASAGYYSARNLMLILSVTTLLLGAYIAFRVTRSITTPISKAVGVANQLANGDLTARIVVDSGDETGKLLQAMQNMVNKLKDMISEVLASADQVSSTASQLSASSRQVAEGSSRQSEATSSMASAVEEMTVSIDQVSDNAQKARAASLSSGEMSQQGAVVIQNAVLEMTKIEETVKGFSSIIESLERESDEISAIVNVIKEIADQTNLLALNAAIEAARAGEQGRGFAVVADEVRKLAERTGQSTQEIATMIAKIQSGTRDAVTSIESGVAQVNSGVALANQAGGSITQIKTEAAQVAQVVSDISDSLKEQSVASNEIARNVEKIAQMTEENSAAVMQSASAAKNLEQLATSLHNTISRFKI